MYSLSIMLAGVIGVAAIATMAGCAPTASTPTTTPTAQAQACPAGVPWVPAGYGGGKFIPGHCQGQPAQ